MSEPTAPEGADPRDQPGRVARNIASVAGSQIGTWAFAAVAIVIVPRALGPEQFGQLGVVRSLWALAGIFIGFGAGGLITREISQDVDWGSRVISNVLPMQTIVWSLCAVTLVGYGFVTDADQTTWALLMIVGVGSLFGNWKATLNTGIIGRERIGVSSALSVADRALVAGLTVSVVLLGFGVEAVAGVNTFMHGAMLIALVVVTRRDPAVKIAPSLADAKKVLRQAAPLAVLGGALAFYREIDVIALSALADETAVGFYSATDRLFGAMIVIPAAVAGALYPTLSRRWVSDPDGVLSTLHRVTGLLGVFTVPVSVGAVMLGPELAVLILGEEFEKTGDVMRIYGLVLIPVGWTVVLGTLCRIKKTEHVWTKVLIVSALATIPLDIVLVPWADDRFENAALAGALAFLVTESGAVAFGAYRVLPGMFSATVRRMLFRSTLAAGVMAGAVYATDGLHVLFRIVIGGLVYAAAAPALGAVRLGELATLGGPFSRFARFASDSSDETSKGTPPSPPTTRSSE